MDLDRGNSMPFSGAFSGIDRLSAKKVALAVTVIFVILSSSAICFHEPWLDEAQAWLIARDASLGDMFLKLSHIEGHVPFWWLILAIPAKLGVPYEIGLKAVNILIAAAACAVFEFKSPFPNAFKLAFPFTYFFFFQYSVVTRPYMLLILALFLAAVSFKERDSKPVFHLLSLILLCLADSFGIAIAGGIAIGWTLTVVKRIVKKDPEPVKNIVKPAVCLSVLLITAIVLILTILPSKDATATGRIDGVSMLKTLFLEIFMLPSDLCFTSFTTYDLLSSQDFRIIQILIAAVVSITVWVFFFKAFSKKEILPDLILPIATFMLLGSVYIYSHHFGLLLMLGIYCAWISLDRSGKISLNPVISWTGKVLCVISLFAGIVWTGFAAVNDIIYPYWISRDLYGWIEKNDLEDYSWFATWDVEFEGNTDVISKQNTAVTRETIPVNPYIVSRKPLNFNNEGYAYALFRENPEDQNEKDISVWKEQGAPDLILCSDVKEAMALMNVMGYGSAYDIVYVKESRYSWKADFTKGGVIVLARKDIGLKITPDVADYASLIGQDG